MLQERLDLAEALDHLLDRGVVLAGQATLSLAQVDLVHLKLCLLLSSVETLQARGALPVRGGEPSQPRRDAVPQAPPGPRPGPYSPAPQGRGRGDAASLGMGAAPLPPLEASPAAGEDAARGLARLVLALVELLRGLLERQAVRRVEGGSLSEEEVERLGRALLELEARMAELRRIFALEETDLRLELGPLGKLA